MKTIKSLKSDIEQILLEMKDAPDKKIKGLKNKVAYLKTCLMYIESEPAVEFVKKEKERLTNRINKFMDLYVSPEGWGSTLKSKHKRDYEKEMGVTKLRKQLSTIHFILK